MECSRFLGALEALVDGESPGDEFDRHAAECASCGLKLARARHLVTLLRGAHRPAPPPELRAAVFAAARPEPLRRLRLARVAAAVLVFVSLSAAIGGLLTGGEDYVPLDLTVLPLTESGATDDEQALELMFGPSTPIGFAAKGGPGVRSER
jgi:anti-sigma factor RsiW